jgi:hypothetical protein
MCALAVTGTVHTSSADAGTEQGVRAPRHGHPFLKGRHFARPEENATQCEACRTRFMVATTI